MATCEFTFVLKIENGESSSFGDGSPEQLHSRNAQIKYLLGQAAGIIATHSDPVPLVATDGTIVGSWEFN